MNLDRFIKVLYLKSSLIINYANNVYKSHNKTDLRMTDSEKIIFVTETDTKLHKFRKNPYRRCKNKLQYQSCYNLSFLTVKIKKYHFEISEKQMCSINM